MSLATNPGRGGRGAGLWLALVFAWLYLPVASLVLFSFSDSHLPNVWRGFTLRWYAGLAQDQELWSAIGLTLQIGVGAASAAVVLGTLAALGLERNRGLRGRAWLEGMVQAPLVLPKVLVGLALLMLLVSLQGLSESLTGIGFPERGALTIGLGHVLVGMAYTTVLIRARLRSLDPHLEEAAADLGARPAEIFRTVTLPMIGPSVAAAWLVAFTVSLDDVVLAAFLSGPGSTTLSLVLFSRSKLGLDPAVHAVATVMIVVAAVATLLAGWLLARAAARIPRPLPASHPLDDLDDGLGRTAPGGWHD